MKRIITAFIVLICTLALHAQMLMVTENGLPYSRQFWICSPYANGFPGKEVSDKWNENYRITSVSGTNNGWFVSMSQNSPYTMQTYQIDPNFPGSWIKGNWDNGYHITDVAWNGSQWVVVMSQNHGNSAQTYNIGSWNNIASWIKENWDNGYYITNLTYANPNWCVVMSKNPKYVSQGYYFCPVDQWVAKANDEVWKNGNCIQLVEADNSNALTVWCKYSSPGSRIQSIAINPTSSNFIKEQWDNGRYISYVGSTPVNKGYTPQPNQPTPGGNPNPVIIPTPTPIPTPIDNRLSYDYYKNNYDRWASNAQSIYNSLTLLGYKEKQNGTDVGGGALGSWTATSYTGMMRTLRETQREMRNLREEAQRNGYTIPMSPYENISVSF